MTDIFVRLVGRKKRLGRIRRLAKELQKETFLTKKNTDPIIDAVIIDPPSPHNQ